MQWAQGNDEELAQATTRTGRLSAVGSGNDEELALATTRTGRKKRGRVRAEERVAGTRMLLREGEWLCVCGETETETESE